MNILREIQREADVPQTVVLGNGACTNNFSLSSNAVRFIMRRSNASLSSISIEQASMTLSIWWRLVDNLSTIDPKKRGWRSKELQEHGAVKLRRQRLKVHATKQTTTRIHTSQSLPTKHIDKRSDLSLVQYTNETFVSNVSVKPASMMAKEGQIWILPKRTGPIGKTDTQYWNFMKNSFISFLKLEQAYNKKQPNIKAMTLKVNTCLNRSGLNRNNQYFVRKIRTDTADKIEVVELTFSFSLFLFILLYNILFAHFLLVL